MAVSWLIRQERRQKRKKQQSRQAPATPAAIETRTMSRAAATWCQWVRASLPSPAAGDKELRRDVHDEVHEGCADPARDLAGAAWGGGDRRLLPGHLLHQGDGACARSTISGAQDHAQAGRELEFVSRGENLNSSLRH